MKHQFSDRQQPIGQTLIEAGLISLGQIELALKEQQECGWRIGKILVSHGWIEPETVDFFCDRWCEILQEPKKKPLVYYFQEAYLLNKKQIEALLRLQKLKHQKVRFHRLAVEQGYLKQRTVDFFLSYLFDIYDPKSISVAKPYEVLSRYSQGIKDFAGIDLQQSPLMGISLQGITLDGSNLSQVDLSRANLSSSSLIRVNLNRANLTKAILTEANLSQAFLKEANLREACLERANLEAVKLEAADLQSSYLAQASFAGADLTGAKLPPDYPYEVYYDRHTIFDADFNPQLKGWKLINS